MAEEAEGNFNSETNSKSGFVHSIKVPRFYKDASKILQKIDEKSGSLKTLLYQSKHTRKNALYGLITETLKYGPLLNRLLAGTPLSQDSHANPYLAKVLTYELLFGKKYLPGESKPVLAVLKQQTVLENLLQEEFKLKSTHNVDDLILKTVKIPRYVRINTILLTTEDACQLFQEEGYCLIQYNKNSYDDFLQRIRQMHEGEFAQDFHVPDLLVFHPSQSFFGHYLYEEGKVILQDKASCLPTYLLNPSPGSVTIDACAAPGLKTTHLAALMKNSGTLIAIDRSAERMETLAAHLLRCGVTCGQNECSDFSTIDPLKDPYTDAQYILVDPSCSGSGIAARSLEESKSTVTHGARLRKLSWFQLTLLSHALSFPNVRRVVYSTCSTYEEENEEVVAEALKRCPGFRLEVALPEWRGRGVPGHPDVSEACLRAYTQDDLTNGFFVAVFVPFREKEEETEQQKRKREKDDSGEKRKKKKTKDYEEDKDVDISETAMKNTEEDLDVYYSKKKKKKRIDYEDDEDEVLDVNIKKENSREGELKQKKKKKKIKDYENDEFCEATIQKEKNTEEELDTKQKKKKRKGLVEEENNKRIDIPEVNENEEEDTKQEKKKKKKNKKKHKETEAEETEKKEEEIIDNENIPKKKRKRKKSQ